MKIPCLFVGVTRIYRIRNDYIILPFTLVCGYPVSCMSQNTVDDLVRCYVYLIKKEHPTWIRLLFQAMQIEADQLSVNKRGKRDLTTKWFNK